MHAYVQEYRNDWRCVEIDGLHTYIYRSSSYALIEMQLYLYILSAEIMPSELEDKL